ncbi:MAG: DNA repair protein RecO [Bdellovibrionaceae bacterium]|nr:DNA repair protein RecO [Bdellovibrionales bacterium]MCB9084707.1 DNA repair protein RecO [Pseudobdellovibrionaceae bacterium]
MIKDRAIILKTVKHGESNLIVQCLSRNGSRLSLMAKGALKSRRRFGGGVLEPLNYIQLAYKESNKKNDDQDLLHWLEEAQILEDFASLRSDYDRLELGFYFLQVVSKISLEGTPDNNEVFDLLGNALKSLQSTSHLGLLRTLFELKLLFQQGVLSSEVEGYHLLKYPLKSHAEINIDEGDLLIIRREVNQLLESYLHA